MSSLIHNFAMNRDSKIYEYIKQFTKSHTLPLQLHLGANVANTDYDKAELFNQYFFSVFTNSDFQVPNLYILPTINDHVMHWISCL